MHVACGVDTAQPLHLFTVVEVHYTQRRFTDINFKCSQRSVDGSEEKESLLYSFATSKRAMVLLQEAIECPGKTQLCTC